MAFDEYLAEINLLMSQMGDAPEDDREILARLHTLISTLRAEGLPVPDDLKKLEADLQERFGET
ncbi:MAG: hypothetical protein RIM33_02330 [Alphaproteobacteria bacterium]